MVFFHIIDEFRVFLFGECIQQDTIDLDDFIIIPVYA